MDIRLLGIIVFAIYGIVILIISYYANKKTSSLNSFAVGNRDMSVGVVSLTLAASFTSSAMLQVIPGYIYFDGLSGVLYILVFQQVGLLTGLLVVGNKIRNTGMNLKVISLPDYLQQKYNSNSLGNLISLLTLSLITYMILVVVGVAYLLMNLLNISYFMAILLTVVFVFGYSLVGGSYVHSYTNVFQSMLMLIIVVYIFLKALPDNSQMWTNFTAKVITETPDYFKIINKDSLIFSTYFEVVFASFLMGFCNVFQPHIFNKALYLKKEKSWNKVAFISFIVMTIFNLTVVSGLFIRMRIPGLANPDSVMSIFITQELPKGISVFVTVALTAAAMSTLDGVIVGMSAAIGGVLNKKINNEQKSLAYTRYLTIIIGIIIILLAYKPPKYIGIYGMWGFNILMSASFVPMLLSMYLKKASVKAAFSSSITAIIVFVIIMTSGITINGAFGCGVAIPCSVVVGLIVNHLDQKQKQEVK